ncbi:metalloproteinase inhibitor 3 [Thrips palmi]|uniref:Metalloproteinase inhibitor 3 n=1 Tax=Thrips palmi TaxID=161013 RepID=A0A6P8YUP4_THRPL|nr:metalloproteinase inhibitor 3 [Thrips palmi]
MAAALQFQAWLGVQAWLWLCLLVALGPRLAHGCMCAFTHPQEQYCRADFAVLAKIIQVKDEGDYFRRYEVAVKRTFKGGLEARMLIKEAGVVASSVDSMCGVTLDEGESYLLMGRVYDGQPRVSLCDFPTPWRKVTVRQRKGLRQQYEASCSCKPRDCPWWGGSHRAESCLIAHSVCTSHRSALHKDLKGHKQQRCNWLRGRVLDDCLRGAGIANVEAEHSWWLHKQHKPLDKHKHPEKQDGGPGHTKQENLPELEEFPVDQGAAAPGPDP